MSCLSLLDDCVMIKYSKEIQMLCQDFSCGNEDLDDFFKNGAIKYDEDLMGKTYCWLTETKPHKVVALVTLANDSIKTAFIGKPSRNKLNRSIANQKRGRSYPATLIGRLGVNVEFQGFRVGGQVIDFLKKWFRDDGNKTGCRFMVVDAYNNERTLRFYESNEFHYLHATEDEERKYYNLDSEKAIHTRLMYMDLINK